MNLEQQVVSLDLAKRLKELGVKQESLYFWHEHYGADQPTLAHETNARTAYPKYAAFTVAELGEIFVAGGYSRKTKLPNKSKFTIGIPRHYLGNVPKFYSDNEADARAKLLIYLIEQKLLDPATLAA